MIDRTILELAEELVDPTEKALEEMVEQSIEAECDILLCCEDAEDELIEFIDRGETLSITDPVDFSNDFEYSWR